MQSTILLYLLTVEHQRERRAEAEVSQQVKEAEASVQVMPAPSLKNRLGEQLIEWGLRLQDGAASGPLAEVDQTSCSD